MFIRFRPVETRDLPECFAACANRFLWETPAERDGMIALWHELLQTRRMTAAIMEDALAPEGKRVVWYCVKVFPNNEIADRMTNADPDTPPYFSRRLFDLWQNGKPLPLLTEKEIARANTPGGNGLNMYVLHYGSPDAVAQSPACWEEVSRSLIAFTEYFSSGYSIRVLLEEFYGDTLLELAVRAGFDLCNNYADYYAKSGEKVPSPDRMPCLTQVRAGAQKAPGTIAATVLTYEPPRFGFKRAEQELLLLALLGETDDAVAARLCVAPVTVRKRYEAIYEKVGDILPALFAVGGTGGETGGRGTERKRVLLSYLRHHFEELRPYVPVGA